MPFAERYYPLQTIPIRGDIAVPDSFESDAQLVIPTAMVNFGIDHFKLKWLRGLDPMFGFGTIPGLINRHGGHCIGLEINPIRYEVAKKTYGRRLFCGDFLQHPLMPQSFDYIFTSMPFSFFNDENFPDLTPAFAQRFHEVLKPSGFLLLDSMPLVIRGGETLAVAERSTMYLENNCFVLEEVFTFEADKHIDSTSISCLMRFLKKG